MQFIKIKEEKFNIYYHELLAGKVVYKFGLRDLRVDIVNFTCFSWVLRVPPSGDGREGIVDSVLGFVGGLMAAESRSTNQTSSGTMGSLLYFRKEEGSPIT